MMRRGPIRGMTARRRKRPIGETLGGIIVGFDQQIFRTTPPAEELIAKGRPVRGLSGQDGSELQVVFPDEGDPLEPAPPEPAPPASAPPDATLSEPAPSEPDAQA